ncbi:sex-determining region Y protein-like isoform X2 [Takifugu rubripes]|uniref:Sex-determining region Y protein-like n=1 Tax=Takifugu rubripes TaxID=31033 RepID=A0A674P490_TAKRU|nr:sex-determining region Y protein-like isoform X2 [Takifugu rubripes]
MDLATVDEDAFLKLLDDILDDTRDDDNSQSRKSNNEDLLDKGIVHPTVLEEPPGLTLDQEAPSNSSNLLNQNTVHQAPLLFLEAIKEQLDGGCLVYELPTGNHTKVPLIGYLNGQKVYQCPPELETLLDLQKNRQEKKKRQQVAKDDKPYIKKPPNAFMLFMKEKRPTVAPELWKQGSGVVNQVLGKMWGTLSDQEKAVYFEEAERCKKLHQLENPGWTTKDNYGQKRRRERKRTSIETEEYTPQVKKRYARKETGAQPRVMPGNDLQTGAMPPFYPQPVYMPNYHSQHAYMQRRQQRHYMQLAQQGPYMQYPQQGPYMQCPQQGGYMQFPQQGGYMQFLQQRYMQDPQGYVQFPHEGYAHYLQQGGYMENPQQAANMHLVHQRPCVQNPFEELHMNHPQEDPTTIPHQQPTCTMAVLNTQSI